MKFKGFNVLLAVMTVFTLAYCNKPQHSTASGRVFFVEPENGAEIQGKVKVVMGVEGMTVKPAGELVEGTGHHHIIINGSGAPEGEVVPADDTHKHYGKGQTETELELEPGEYTLTLQFANGLHQSYGPEFSQTINITVK